MGGLRMETSPQRHGPGNCGNKSAHNAKSWTSLALCQWDLTGEDNAKDIEQIKFTTFEEM